MCEFHVRLQTGGVGGDHIAQRTLAEHDTVGSEEVHCCVVNKCEGGRTDLTAVLFLFQKNRIDLSLRVSSSAVFLTLRNTGNYRVQDFSCRSG